MLLEWMKRKKIVVIIDFNEKIKCKYLLTIVYEYFEIEVKSTTNACERIEEKHGHARYNSIDRNVLCQ